MHLIALLAVAERKPNGVREQPDGRLVKRSEVERILSAGRGNDVNVAGGCDR